MNMKKLTVFLLAACLALPLCGCGKKTALDGEALVSELLEKAQFTDSLDRLDDKTVPVLYGVDAADYTAAIVYAGTGATAEEIAVFTCADEAAAGRVLTAVQARVNSQIEAYKNYGPADTLMLQDAVVRQSGVYVVMVVCGDSDTAAKIVDKYL